MAFFILTRFVLVKYSRAFVERPSQGTSSLASRLTTVSLDIYIYIYIYQSNQSTYTNLCMYVMSVCVPEKQISVLCKENNPLLAVYVNKAYMHVCIPYSGLFSDCFNLQIFGPILVLFHNWCCIISLI